MTTGEWFVLIPLNQGLFLNDLRIWRGDGRGVLIPLNQGLFLNITQPAGATFPCALIPLNQGLFLNPFTSAKPAQAHLS